MVSHVLEPKQRAVGGTQEQTLEGNRILGPQVGIHQLSLPLHQGPLCRLLLFLQLVARLFLRLVEKKVSGEFDAERKESKMTSQHPNMCILAVGSPCCFRLVPLHRCTPPPLLQRQVSGSSAPHPRRNPLLPAAWTDLRSCASPAETEQIKMFTRLWLMTLLQSRGIYMPGKNTDFYTIRLGVFFVFLVLPFSEVHLHSAVTVISLFLRCLLFLLWGLCLFLGNKQGRYSKCVHL